MNFTSSMDARWLFCARILLVALSLFCLLPGPAGAATFYVDVSWTGTHAGTTNQPFQTVKAAADVANTNGVADTIYVADGTYLSTSNGGFEDFGAGGIAFSQPANQGDTAIYGGYVGWVSGTTFDWTAPSRAPRSTVIDLTGAGARAFNRTGSGELNWMVTVDGFTFQNASHSGDGGAVGGVDVSHTGWMINNCLFSNNVTAGKGGAIYAYGQWQFSVVITNCDFVSNTGGDGGALYIPNTGSFSGANKCRVVNSRFVNNIATNSGGALCIYSAGGQPEVRSCDFRGNRAGTNANGGAVLALSSGAPGDMIAFVGCRFVGNSAKNGGAVYSQQTGARSFGLSFTNCLFTGNTATNYTVYHEGWIVTTTGDPYGVDMTHCTVAGNTGGGIKSWWYYDATYGYGGNVRLRDTIVATNGGFGVYYDYSSYVGGNRDPAILFSDVWGHATNYGDDAVAGVGTITNDPVFKALATNDCRLQWWSPCVNTATNLGIGVDVDGVLRPQHLGYDRGCYEAIPPATVRTLPATNVLLTSANLNGDLVVTNDAPTTVLVYWGASNAGLTYGWANTNSFGPVALGPITTNVSLLTDTVYYYRYQTSNSQGVVWAETGEAFMTCDVTIETTANASETGLVPGTFTVHRAAAATNETIPLYFSTGGTATGGVHYVSIGTNVNFLAGQSNATITVTPINDTACQVDTTVTVTLVNGPYRIGAPYVASLTITNTGPQTMTLAATDAAADEMNQDPGVFTINRSGNVVDPVVVRYVISGTASTSDYVSVPVITGALVMAAGQTATSIVVTPVLDWYVEGNETLTLALTNGSYDIGNPSNGTVTIANYAYAAFSNLYVDVNWTNNNGLGTSTNPSRTVTRVLTAMHHVGTGKRIVVADGTCKSLLNGGLENFGTNGLFLNLGNSAGSIEFYGGYVGWTSGTNFDWGGALRVPRSTVMDMAGAGARGICRASSATLDWMVTVDGFTFQNANHSGDGGAIGGGVVAHTGWILNNCLFTNNVTTGKGGAAYVWAQWQFPGTITNCDFVNNTGGDGGAVYVYEGNFTGNNKGQILNSRFVNNVATNGGGGICIYGAGGQPEVRSCDFLGNRTGTNGNGGAVLTLSSGAPGDMIPFVGCRFIGNSAKNGGAAYSQQTGARNFGLAFTNCLFYGNTATNYTVYHDGWIVTTTGDPYGVDMSFCTMVDNTGGGTKSWWYYDATYGYGGNVRLRNTIVSGNGSYGVYYDNSAYAVGNRNPAIIFSDVNGHTADYGDDAVAGAGTISLNPMFVDRPAFDYHLRSRSPCVDTGTNIDVMVDLSGTNRPLGKGYDMGCYETVPPRPGSVFVAH